jgi:hypothetical protein
MSDLGGHPVMCLVTRRKKDHGRAEAMLIAAWALGVRTAPEAADEDAAALDEEGDCKEDAPEPAALVAGL